MAVPGGLTDRRADDNASLNPAVHDGSRCSAEDRRPHSAEVGDWRVSARPMRYVRQAEVTRVTRTLVAFCIRDMALRHLHNVTGKCAGQVMVNTAMHSGCDRLGLV